MTDKGHHINLLKDELARRAALLDQLQASLNTNQHQFSEDRVWEIQADIDVKRFNLELDRLSLKATIF